MKCRDRLIFQIGFFYEFLKGNNNFMLANKVLMWIMHAVDVVGLLAS